MGQVLKMFQEPDSDASKSSRNQKTKNRGNGQGSIFYDDVTKMWKAQYTAGRKADGSLNRPIIFGKTEKEVSKKLTKALEAINTQTYVEKADLTVIDLATRYVDSQFASGNLAIGSYERKKNTIKIISKLPFANMKIQKVDAGLINYSLPNLKNYSMSVIKKVTGLLNTTFDYAVGLQIINSNPFKVKGIIQRPKSNKETKEVTAFTVDEQKQFLDVVKNSSDPYIDVMLISLYTGMRVGEILALRGSDIDKNNRMIKIKRTLTIGQNDSIILGKTTKTYSSKRDIPYIDILDDVFARHSSSDFLFLLPNGNFVRPTTINSHFTNLCTKAGIRLEETTRRWRGEDHIILRSDVNTHMLRHTFATRCIEAHMDFVTLSRLLGHNDIKTTINTYTSVFNKQKLDELSQAQNYLKTLNKAEKNSAYLSGT